VKAPADELILKSLFKGTNMCAKREIAIFDEQFLDLT
jgi:hypothetical protein